MFLKILDIFGSIVISVYLLVLYFVLYIISFFRRSRLRGQNEKKILYFVVFPLDVVKKLGIFDDMIKHYIILDNYFKKAFLFHLDFYDNSEQKKWATDEIHWRRFKVHKIISLLRRTSALITEARILLEGFELIFKEKINIVQAQDAHILGINAWLLSRLGNIPFLLEIVTDYEAKNRGSKGLSVPFFRFAAIERFVERMMMKKADLIYAGQKHYLDCGLVPSSCKHKYFTSGWAVSNRHLKPPEERRNIKPDLGLSSSDYLVLYVGRLQPEKYASDLIHCFKKIYERISDTYFIIIGVGILKDEIMRGLLRDIPKERIFYFESKTQDELVDFFSSSDVIVFPSAGRTAIEAALSSAPIVAYDFEFHHDTVKDGETGKLVKFRDYEALANEACYMLKNPDYAKSLGRNARSFALEHFNEDVVLKRLKMMYKQVL